MSRCPGEPGHRHGYLVLAALLVVVVGCTAAGAVGSNRQYLPVVRKDVPPTATPTVTGTPTPVQLIGEVVTFAGSNGRQLQVTFTGAEFRDSLVSSGAGAPVTPDGVFLVVLADVMNPNLDSDVVPPTAFHAVDSVGRRFDPAPSDAQQAAQSQYARKGFGATIQPGFTLKFVFVFDVLPSSTGLYLASTSAATPVVTGVPTSQVPTPVAPQVFGTTVSASSEVVGNEAAKAADQNESTFWRPAPGDGAPELDVVLDSPQQVNYVRFVNSIGDGGTTTSTPTAGPTTPTTTAFGATYQISVVQDSGTAAAAAPKTAQGRTSQATIETSCGPSHLLTADDQTVQENCGTTTNVQRIKIKILSSQGGALPGLREVAVYGSSTTPTQTATVTPTGTATPTATATPPAPTRTAQAAASLTALSCATFSNCTPTTVPTDSPTPTLTVTATATATVPPGLDAAQGQTNNAASADSAASHPASLAVDATGTPQVQDPSTYWQANAGATGATTKTWFISSLGGIPVTAAQVRLFMPSNASVSITFRLVDNSDPSSHVDQSISGAYADGQVVGVLFATPVPNVGQVSIIFSQVGVAPGLRTVGIHEPVSR